MKKVVSLLLCAVMLIGLLPVSAFAADGDKFIVTADKTEVAAGDQIKITTTVESVSECDAMGLIFSFDHELFELVRISCNAELLDEYEESLIATSAAAKTEGKEGYAISFYDPQVYTGKVGNMFLKVKDDASFTSTTITAKTSNKLKGADVEYSVNEIVITMPTAETTAPTEPEHVHTWTDVAAVAPTCHTDGNIAYQICSECGAAQTADENPMPLSKFGWVLAAEHTGLVHYDAVEVTCDTDGHEAYDYCEDCQVFVYEDPLKLSYQDGVIPATGHAWTDIAAVEPTCDTDGNIAYQLCSNCGAAQTAGPNPMPLSKFGWVLAALGHTWVDHAAVAPTCHTDGNIAYQQCSVCGAAQTAGENPMPLGKFGWVLAAEHTGLVHYDAVEATCDTDGHEAYDYCEDCQVFVYADPLKLSYQDGVIPALGHDWVKYEAVAPSCNAEGNIAYMQCSVCGAAQTDEAEPKPLSKFGWVLAATGEHTFEHHDAIDATCDTEGHEAFDYCTTCECFFYADPLKLTYQAGIILPLGHTWTDVAAVAPTCHADGNIAYQLCSVCGAAQTAGENPIPLSKFGWVLAAQHTGLVHHEAVEATCDTDGHEAFDFCEDCEVFIYEDPLKLSYQDGVIPATGHNVAHVEALAPSCHSLGNVEYWYCVDCGYAWLDEEMTKVSNLKSVILPALGNEEMVHFEAVAPACHSLGNIEYWFCPECEAYYQDEACTQLTNSKRVILPALGSEKLEHVEALAPACHSLGNIEYWFCPECEGYFQDEACTQVTNSKRVILPELGSEKLVHVAAKAATTETEGNIEYWYCPECEAYFQDEACTQLTNAKRVITPKLEAEVEEKPEQKPEADNDKTGDATPVVALIVMAVLAMFGMALVVVNKKKFSA